MEKREQLLKDLKRIKENQFTLEKGERASDYAASMLENIGDPDPELRDYLIYKAFYRWILVKKYFSKEELRSILSVVLEQEHLYYNIGNEGDDSVFKRSFSVLVAALILAYHRETPILNYDEFLKVKNSLIEYYREEKDLRSYVDGSGWADAVSHGADVLDEVIACKECNEQICHEVLEVIKRKLLNEKYSFYQEEDERITNAVIRAIDTRLLKAESINIWIERLVNEVKSVNNHLTRINVKNFMRSLYFRLIHSGHNSELIDSTLKAEAKLNSYIES